MKTLQIEKRTVDYKSFRLRKAKIDDVNGTLIKENTTVIHNGKPVLLYLNNEAESWGAMPFLETLPIGKNNRSNGLEVQASTFGFLPRVSMRNDCCSSTKLARNLPIEHAKICSWAKFAESELFAHVPEVAGAQKKLLEEKVLPEWKISKLFTSGIINKNYNIVYHLDKANFKTCWSAMAVFKNNVLGGELVLPQFNLALECSNNSIVIFNGSEHLHGVTDIIPHDPLKNWYRYSVVFYPMSGMAKCLNKKEETKRIKMQRTLKENKSLAERRSFKK